MKTAYLTNDRTLVSPTKGPQTLSAGSSTLAMLLAVGGVMALTATPAMAACDATAPVSDQTVTCDTSPPNPETNGIVIAAGTEDVKLIFLPGAILETSGGPAITIGTSNGAGSVNVSHDELFDNQGIIRTIGNHAPAIVVLPDPIQDFGQTTVVLTDVQFGMVETSGSDSPGIVYGEVGGGVGTDGSFVSVDIGATIATAGDRSPGLVNGGIGIGAGQMSDAFLGMAGHEYFVTTQGHDSAGVIFNMLGDTSGTQEILLVSNRFQADTVGDRSPGVIIGANRTATPDTLTSSFQATNLGAFVTTQGDDSVGFFFGPGATPSGDNFNFAAAAIHGTVVTSGDNSHGVIFTEGLSNAQPGTNVNITLSLDAATNFMTATTSGDNAHGIILGDGLGTNRTDMNFESALRIGNGWSATTSGASSHALVISENTTLTLDAANIGALTANGTVVNGTIGTFDGFVATGEGSRAVMNHGILYGTFTVGDDVVGNLGNNGLIESATGASGVAVQFTGTTNDFFELQTQGVVIGTVEAGAGTDTFILGGAGAASFDVGLIGTQYNDFEAFEKTGSSTWTLTGTNAITAPFLVSEGTLVINSTLTASELILGGRVIVNSGGLLDVGQISLFADAAPTQPSTGSIYIENSNVHGGSFTPVTDAVLYLGIGDGGTFTTESAGTVGNNSAVVINLDNAGQYLGVGNTVFGGDSSSFTLAPGIEGPTGYAADMPGTINLVTVAKAKSADRAMNAINSGTTVPGQAYTFRIDGDANFGGSNSDALIFVDSGSSFEVTGDAAFTSGGSSVFNLVATGGNFTVGNDWSVIRGNSSSATSFLAESILSVGNDWLIGGGSSSVATVEMYDSTANIGGTFDMRLGSGSANDLTIDGSMLTVGGDVLLAGMPADGRGSASAALITDSSITADGGFEAVLGNNSVLSINVSEGSEIDLGGDFRMAIGQKDAVPGPDDGNSAQVFTADASIFRADNFSIQTFGDASTTTTTFNETTLDLAGEFLIAAVGDGSDLTVNMAQLTGGVDGDFVIRGTGADSTTVVTISDFAMDIGGDLQFDLPSTNNSDATLTLERFDATIVRDLIFNLSTDAPNVRTVSFTDVDLNVGRDVVIGQGTDFAVTPINGELPTSLIPTAIGRDLVVKGSLDVNGSFSRNSGVTNFGLIRFSGGTLDANSLSNNDLGTLSGYGTVTPRAVNSGLIEATGGTLAMTGGIQGGSGTVAIHSDGALDLSSATQTSSADFLNHQGTASDSLNLGSNDFVVSRDYTNGNFGVGNSFDHRANVVGSGEIVGENAAMGITGDVTPAGTNIVTLDLGNVRGGTSTTVEYQITNTGTGADIRGAVQTAAGMGNLTDARLSGSGVMAQNVGPIEAGENGGNLSVTFTANGGGSLDGQTIGVVSNFDNVVGQTIQITGMATSLAQGNATPAGPIDLGNFRVGQDGPAQSFAVANLTTGAGSERLGIGAADTTGNFAASNNLGAGLIDSGASQANALTASVSGGAAGLNTGSLEVQYSTDGTHIDAGFTAQSVNNQSIALSATGYNVAAGNLNTTSLNFGVVQVGQSVSENLSISNIAAGPNGFVEDLNASFGPATGTGSNLISGSGSIAGLLAGDSDNASMVVSVNTASAGTVNGAIAVNYFSAGAVNGVSNGLGVIGVGSQDFGVIGSIEATGTVVDQAAPLINTGQPILLGNVREGAVSPTAFVSVTNQATGNQQADLNASISGNAPITASGSFDKLGPGATDSSSLQVGMNTVTAGSINGTATIAFVSDAENLGGGQLTLASQDVQVQGAVYRLASAELNAAQPVILAARVGDAVPTQSLGVTNQSPDAFTEGLKADIGSVDFGFTGNGNIANLAAATTDNTSLTVGLADTSASQNISGNVTVDFASTGAGTTEAADISVGNESVQVQGRVYQQAQAQVDTHSVNFGIVHVGDVVGQAVGVTNAAPVAALNDTLVGGFVNLPAGPFDGSGSVSGLGAAQSDATSLEVSLDTSAAGIFSFSGEYLQFASQNPDMADLDLGTQALSFSAQVNNYANPLFQLDSGPASLSAIGLDFLLDFGTLFDDQGGQLATLGFANQVSGPADLLRGDAGNTFSLNEFTLGGFDIFDTFTNLDAGQSLANLTVNFDPFGRAPGSVMETLSITAFGFNASGFQEEFNISLALRAQILERGVHQVSEPPVLLLVLLGLSGLYGLRSRRRQRRG